MVLSHSSFKKKKITCGISWESPIWDSKCQIQNKEKLVSSFPWSSYSFVVKSRSLEVGRSNLYSQRISGMASLTSVRLSSASVDEGDSCHRVVVGVKYDNGSTILIIPLSLRRP